MNAETREAIRSNAKYLRNVRPVDPEEIYQYVEGQPHPAAVRQTLREEAADLGLLEREDGTFVPVEEGSVEVAFDGVDAFPARYATVLEDELADRYGPDWAESETGDRLRERIRDVKERYLQQRDVDYDADTAVAYALYHLPDYYAAVQYVLADLARADLLGRRLRVLDVGAGVGGPALGLADLLPDDALVDYHAVEPSASADLLETLLAETGRNFHSTVHRTTAEAFDPDGEFDLVLAANVLSELDDPAATLARLSGALADDGTLVALAPADRNTATNLRTVERALADDGPLMVYAPTVRLWAGATPTDEMWSFDVKPDLAVPGFQRRLQAGADGTADREDGGPATGETDDGTAGQDDGTAGRDDGTAGRDDDGAAGEFVNVDVQYAYSVLRADGRRRYDVTLDPGQSARFADADSHVTNRVDCYAVKLSHDLSEGGHPLYRLGDGSQSVGHFAVLTEESILNEALRAADYGALLSFENVLYLWNDDERAYNLVVDGETTVDPVV